MTTYTFPFDDWEAFLTDAARPSRAGASSRSDSLWNGVESFNRTLDAAHRGYPQGLALITPVVERYVDRLTARVVHTNWYPDTTGDWFDVGEYVAGVPDHWYQAHSQIVGGTRHIRIVFNATIPAVQELQRIVDSGASVLALTTLLETAGHRVQVENVYCHKTDEAVAEIRIVIKRYDQPLDAMQVATALTHPGMFRRLGFSVMEHYPEPAASDMDVHVGKGRVATPIDCGDTYVAAATGDYDEAWIIAQLHAYCALRSES